MLLAAIDHHPNFSDHLFSSSSSFSFDPFFFFRIIIGGKCERAFQNTRALLIHSSTLLRLFRVTKMLVLFSLQLLSLLISAREEFLFWLLLSRFDLTLKDMPTFPRAPPQLSHLD